MIVRSKLILEFVEDDESYAGNADGECFYFEAFTFDSSRWQRFNHFSLNRQ